MGHGRSSYLQYSPLVLFLKLEILDPTCLNSAKRPQNSLKSTIFFQGISRDFCSKCAIVNCYIPTGVVLGEQKKGQKSICKQNQLSWRPCISSGKFDGKSQFRLSLRKNRRYTAKNLEKTWGMVLHLYIWLHPGGHATALIISLSYWLEQGTLLLGKLKNNYWNVVFMVTKPLFGVVVIEKGPLSFLFP